MLNDENEIIAAIATPIGEGGISVVRVSGRGAIQLVDRCFKGKGALEDAASHTIHYGELHDPSGNLIDEVLVSVFRGPHSYTGEDVVEISCHGGIYIAQRVLRAVIETRARLARPGEFTKRAFLNGRIDLSQAEAVADLISSRSARAHRNSLGQLKGEFSRHVNAIRDELVRLCGLVELELDFVEDEIEFVDKTQLCEMLERSIKSLETLAGSFEYGRLYREGAKVVIVGRPNVGKSSLFNALLDRNRSIVTEIPGTTRDVIEEGIILDGMLFQLIDTAGLRETSDVVEIEGVRRTREQVSEADIILYVADLSSPNDEDDLTYLQELRQLRNSAPGREILVWNKCDIVDGEYVGTSRLSGFFPAHHRVTASALTREGLFKLCRLLLELIKVPSLGEVQEGLVVTNERHRSKITDAVANLKYAKLSLEAGKTGDIVAIDLRRGLECLGEIVGKVTSDEILNNIFSRFCIGK